MLLRSAQFQKKFKKMVLFEFVCNNYSIIKMSIIYRNTNSSQLISYFTPKKIESLKMFLHYSLIKKENNSLSVIIYSS